MSGDFQAGGGANLLPGKSWINYKDPTCRKEESGSSLPSVDAFETKLLIAAHIFTRWRVSEKRQRTHALAASALGCTLALHRDPTTQRRNSPSHQLPSAGWVGPSTFGCSANAAAASAVTESVCDVCSLGGVCVSFREDGVTPAPAPARTDPVLLWQRGTRVFVTRKDCEVEKSGG